ncbi:MAG: ComEC/Rec2 family competence protein, partial [Ostreibacterium sp.]
MKKTVLDDFFHQIPPAFWLFIGLLASLLSLFFTAYTPSFFLIISAAFIALLSFLLQRFFICGLLLGTITIGINTSLPYSQNFTNCQYLVHISHDNYATQNKRKAVRFYASNISCDKQDLPSQSIQYWDNRHQLINYHNQSLTINSQLKPIHARLNINSFDYEKYLITHGVRLVATKLTIINSQPENHPIFWLRNTFADAITKHLSPTNAAIILALVIGNRSALTAEQKSIMKKTGTSHILAISGLHLALVGGLAWLFGQWLWALSWRLSSRIIPIQAGAIVAFIIITIYALLTGFNIPVKRAWVMFSLLIFSWLWLKSFSTNHLLIAAIAVMLVEPYSVISIGFYFSFIATFIVLWCARLPYLPLINIFILQGLINLTLLPIIWWGFDIIPLSAFFVNLLIIPWLGIWILPWAIAACLLSLISIPLAHPMWIMVDFTTTLMWQVITFFSTLPLAFSPHFHPT